MLSYSWDATWQGLPSNGLSRNSLDDHLRRTTVGVRERMEREHQWGPFGDDTGEHRLGKTTVLLTGDAAARGALANMQEGALFLQNDGTNYNLFVYTGAAWVAMTEDVHANMDNLTDDDCHTQYMLKDGIYDESVTVDMGGNILETLAASGVPLVADHPYDNDPHSIAAYTALVDDSISFFQAVRAYYVYELEYSGAVHGFIGALGKGVFQMPLGTRALMYILIKTAGLGYLAYGAVPSAGYSHICLKNTQIFAVDYTLLLGVIRG